MIATGKRCRMHGGKGSGAPRQNRNAFRTGLHTAAMKASWQEVRRHARRAKVLTAEIEAEHRAAKLMRGQKVQNNSSNFRYLLNKSRSDGSVDREARAICSAQPKETPPMRTSVTHPLAIAEISPSFNLGAVSSGIGKVGLTFCPGKKQASAATGAWDRDLALDLDAIEAWGAAAVVTLVEDHELESLEVAGLGSAVADRHMAWYHLPIRDVGTPGEEFELEWRIAGEQLRAILRDGFNVLVHCKGGLGRAGLVSARLLVELGWTPHEAVKEIRRVRPGAIETDAQLGYVNRLASAPAPWARGHDAGDRALGAMLGLAVGDALGTTLEFSARDTAPRLTDMIGGGPFNLEPGQWTDDTAMALALTDSLLFDPLLNETQLMESFVLWHEKGQYSCTGACFDIGNTVRSALARFKLTGYPIAGPEDPYSAGNGSLMRLAPVAIRHWRNREPLFDVAIKQGRTTHGAREAIGACIVFAEMLADAIQGKPRATLMEGYPCDFAPTIAKIMGGSWRGKHRGEIRASGYVVHSLKAALWCVGRTGTFRDAVLLAANLGEDADTTAAITGQLAGAIYGASAIPEDWLEKLAWREDITARTLDLFTASLT
jgi:ADP-ribosyl-[dinitrogen reductase] hydrolase